MLKPYCGVKSKSDQQQETARSSVNKVYVIVEMLPDAITGPDEDPLKTTITALANHFTPKTNVAYQEPGEDLMTYYSRLKHVPETSEFADADREIKSDYSTMLIDQAAPQISLQSWKYSSITGRPWSLPKHKSKNWKTQKKK